MKDKDYKELLMKIKSSNSAESVKLRKLSDTFVEYFKSAYSDSAIKLANRMILSKYAGQEEVPTELHNLFLQAAKYYVGNGMYAEASALLEKLENSSNLNILLEVKAEKDLIKVRQSAEAGEIDQKSLDDLKTIAGDDEQHDLDTAQRGRFNDYDYWVSYFEDIPVEAINAEIFPPTMSKPGSKIDYPSPWPGGGTSPKSNQYTDALSADKRLEFIKNNFKIEKIRVGRDRYAGTIIFEIADSDLVIAENFYRIDKDGNCIEDYGKATYILPKTTEFDLLSLSRGELREQSGKEGKIASIRHINETYYERLLESFRRLNSKEPVVQSSHERKLQKMRPENAKFLSSLNANLGNILNEKNISDLVKNAGYSLERVYGRLKPKIIQGLKALDTPKEQLETEAQKVFIYMKITKRMGTISYGVISKKQLTDVLAGSILEYKDGLSFYLNHKDDGLTTRQLTAGIKKFIEENRSTKDLIESEQTVGAFNGQYGPLLGTSPEISATEVIDTGVLYARLTREINEISDKLRRANRLYDDKKVEYSGLLREGVSRDMREGNDDQAEKTNENLSENTIKEILDENNDPTNPTGNGQDISDTVGGFSQ